MTRRYEISEAGDLARNSRVMREGEGGPEWIPFLVDRVEPAEYPPNTVVVTYSSGDAVAYGKGFPVIVVHDWVPGEDLPD